MMEIYNAETKIIVIDDEGYRDRYIFLEGAWYFRHGQDYKYIDSSERRHRMLEALSARNNHENN